jgi:glycosyltransferase involved in cell wall biosynthesis
VPVTRLLLISDHFAPSEHSAIEGVFGRGLPGLAETAVVEFCRDPREACVTGLRAVLPARCRRAGLVAAVDRAWPGKRWDFVVVRNKFPALRQFLASRSRTGIRVGFWLSFPHSFRRFHEAQVAGRGVWRKGLEYRVRDWGERRLLRRCDCFLPITETLVHQFYPTLGVPWQALPMGVDFAGLPAGPKPARAPGPLRLVYTGTIDSLRRVDLIVAGLQRVSAPFLLDLYTGSDNAAVGALRAVRDDRIRLWPSRPRAALFEALRTADIGIGLIPDTPLYRVASPTKTLEYAALGLVPLVNSLPEYVSLFTPRSAAFAEFTPGAIRDRVEQLAAAGPEALAALGENAREIIRSRRDYRQLAGELAAFLNRLPARA